MKKYINSTLVIASFFGIAHAETTSNYFKPNFSAESISTSASLGMLSGESKEFVYDADTGYKLSQLDWKINNVAIIKADLSWEVYPFLTLNARGWTSLGSGSGRMDDYDWLDENQAKWTHHSSHPNTNVNYANEFDLNFKTWFVQSEDYKAGIVAGYQETRFSWTARGGRYSYNNGTDQGYFKPGERGIGYSQRFSMPYIGLVGRYNVNDFEFNAQFKFSDWVTGRDNDEHYQRNLTFNEKTSNSRFYGASVDAGYFLTPNAKVFIEYTYSKYEEGKGDTKIIDRKSGEIGYIGGDSAGMSNYNQIITAGLQYRF